MLNLYVRLTSAAVLWMKLRLLLLSVLLMIAAQDSPPLAITFPRAGDVLRGQVTITGTTDIANFLSAQLDFAYASNIIPEGGSPRKLVHPPNHHSACA